MNKSFLALVLSSFMAAGTLLGHPVPDVPVRSFFEADGSTRIEVEVDLRCFTADPENEPYLMHWTLKEMAEAEKAALLKKAEAFVKKSIAFRLAPGGQIEPTFEWRFTTHRGEALTDLGDPVMLTGVWQSETPAEAYQIEALPAGNLSVLFLNHVNDTAVERFQVLFPGEKSYELKLADLHKPRPGN